MNMLSRALPLAFILTCGAALGQNPRRHPPSPAPHDQVALAKQFIKVMYPRLRGSDLMITYTLLDDRLDLAPPSYHLRFLVQKFCNPPADAKIASVGNMFRPCGDYDKDYKDPLSGEIFYRRKGGTVSLYRGYFGGVLVRVPEQGKATAGGVCTERTFVTQEQLVGSIPRKGLGPLLGGIVSIDGVDPQDPYGADYGEWIVRLTATRNKRHLHYAFSFDACGTLHSFRSTD